MLAMKDKCPKCDADKEKGGECSKCPQSVDAWLAELERLDAASHADYAWRFERTDGDYFSLGPIFDHKDNGDIEDAELEVVAASRNALPVLVKMLRECVEWSQVALVDEIPECLQRILDESEGGGE